MTSRPRRGRRDNGLDAVAFRPLRDVDPRVGEHLLDLLREAGIAAYLDPTSDVDAVTRSIALPSPPSDRLHVDRSRVAAATSVVEAHFVADGPELPHPDRRPASATGSVSSANPSPTAGSAAVDEAQWQELVTTYERDHGRLGDTLTQDFDLAAQESAEKRAAAQAADDEAAQAAEVFEEEHYEPPPPPPLPVLSRMAVNALVLLTGGALLLIAPGVVGLSREVGFVLGVLGVASGVGMLVWRMREGPQYEDPDDGAIV